MILKSDRRGSTRRRVLSSTINCLTFIQQNEYFQCRHRHVHPRLLIDKTQINSSRFFCDFVNGIDNGRKAAISREFQKLSSNATRYYETYCVLYLCITFSHTSLYTHRIVVPRVYWRCTSFMRQLKCHAVSKANEYLSTICDKNSRSFILQRL